MRPPLAILTPAGSRCASRELDAVAGLLRAFNGLSWISTEKTEPAKVDGFLYDSRSKPQVLKAICEVKSREMTLRKLKGDYGFQWLITAQKIADGAMLSRSLCAPFVGILHLVPDNVILIQRLVNSDGSYAVGIKYEQTITPATINGGRVTRLNAFVNMSEAKLYKL